MKLYGIYATDSRVALFLLIGFIKRLPVQHLFVLITAFIDLNIAVIGGTILFYIGKKYLKYNDVSADFADEEAEKDVEQGAA